LYIGGFLGPFGSPIVVTMLPEIGDSLNVSVATAATSLTAYLVPFAALMLISGTLAERFGRRRTVQVGYIVYTLASIGCALAPSFAVLMIARVVQGGSNAFTTPVLVAAVSVGTPRERLGRALGLFGSMQATGQAMAPLVGGLAASVDWRLAFWGTAVVSALLALLPPRDAKTGPVGSSADRWKVLANRKLAVACVVAALAFLTTMGVTILAALYADDAFGLGPTARGLVVAVFGLAGLATGRWLGSLMDRFNMLAVGAAMLVVLGVGAALIGVAPTIALMVVCIGVAGAAATGTRTVSQNLAVTSAPTNRSGAVSVMLACQFGGAAIAPLLWVPIYQDSQSAALVLAGIPAILAGLVLLVARRLKWAET
jgi:MFS family permease